MKIFFIRHGESLANVGKVSAAIEKDAKNKLTPTGLAQIQKTAQNIDVKISAVYASPMRRTIESAKAFIDNIVVFSHGRAISMVEAEFCSINKIQKKHIHTDNGTVKELEVFREIKH